MQNRDNLEKFIKEEVNRIEFNDVDSMWQDFQGQLEKEKRKSKKGFWFWFGILSIIVFGGFLFNHMNNHANKLASKNIQESTTKSFKNTAFLPTKLLDKNEKTAHLKNEKSNSILEEKVDNHIIQNITNTAIVIKSKTNLTTKLNTEIQKEIVQKEPISKINEVFLVQEHLDKSLKLTVQIATLESRELLIPIVDKKEKLISINSEWQFSKSNRFYFSLENSFGKNGIRKHSFGVGKYFTLKNNFVIKVQTGGSMDVGHSFSQDSIFILNGLSIKEVRKNKDLKKIGNAYLELGFYYQKNNWQMGFGTRGNYALLNQFYFEENTHIKHLGTFNSSTSTTNERKGKDNWSGINRGSFDGFLNVNYQLGGDYSIGFVLEKRLNKLIKRDLARQSYSNTPVKFGLIVRKYL